MKRSCWEYRWRGAVDGRWWCKRWPCASDVDGGTEMERTHRYGMRRKGHLFFDRK